ncbi:uncharacterized protein LOC126298296 [Schistocerca gregaria]|uniref:uncharacterized protein LOC126298296 n=1 Tax=Schistocerca gregaria TaxID=7010 RepID=UPI00211DCA43|nr:uncharacterized protein LOC126298296 [Schistocerca gregaria]
MAEEQLRFQKDKSMPHAISNLIDDTEDALRHPQGKFHAVFIDYTKSFDKLNRRTLISKLESITGKDKLITLIHNRLMAKFIQVIDDVSTPIIIPQANCILQGHPLMPLLFIVASYDVSQVIRN